jgi:hypothetical protein
MPSSMRAPPPEIESRVFPRKTTSSSFISNHYSSSIHPLYEYNIEEQHLILMREILLVLSGIEGNYIRVVAAAKTLAPSSASSAAGQSGTIEEEELRQGYKSFHQSIHSRLANPISLMVLLPSIDSIKLYIDVDNADKSSATQVSIR